jgi:hypothetical protein
MTIATEATFEPKEQIMLRHLYSAFERNQAYILNTTRENLSELLKEYESTANSVSNNIRSVRTKVPTGGCHV